MEPCCQKPENRTILEDRGDLKVEQCVCGRKHYELTVDPVEVGVKVSAL